MIIEDSVFVYRLLEENRLSLHGRYHAHEANEFEIHFFIEGSGHFQCNNTRYVISNSTVYLTGPRQFHSVIPGASTTNPLSWYAFLFSFDLNSDVEDKLLYEQLELALYLNQNVTSVDSNFRFQFEDLYQLARSKDNAFRGSARYLLASFLWRWFGREKDGSSNLKNGLLDTSKRAKRQYADHIHVEKALAFMQSKVYENIRVDDISRQLNLSTEHFIRLFKTEVNMTPGQYFTRLKIEGASGLLMSTDKPIGEISDVFGFENQFHFSRIFKKCTGMSPMEYRKNYLQVKDFS